MTTRTTTWWRRCGSELGSGTEAQLWARPPSVAAGSVDQEPREWRGACGSAPTLPSGFSGRSERAALGCWLGSGGWRPGPFGGITALRGARGAGASSPGRPFSEQMYLWLGDRAHAAVATLCAWSRIREMPWAGPLHSLPCPRPSPSVGHEPDLPCSRVRPGALRGHHHTQQAGSGCLLSAGPRSPDASHSLGLNPSSVTLSEAPAALCCSFPICEMGTVMPQSHSED